MRRVLAQTKKEWRTLSFNPPQRRGSSPTSPTMTPSPHMPRGEHCHSIQLNVVALQLRPQQTPSPLSLAPRARPWSSVVVRRPFCGHLELQSRPLPRRASPPNQQRETPSGSPPVPLFRAVRAHRPFHRAAGAPPPSTQGIPASLPLLKRSRVPSRGEQLPHALNFSCTALLSAQTLTGVNCAAIGLLRHEPRPLVPLRLCAGVMPITESAVSP
jgi:hypothetical protein